MAALSKSVPNVNRHSFLHLYIAAFKCFLGETRLLKRGLHVHAEIDDIGYKLRVGLRLVPTTHDAEADVHIALFHECWNDGVERTLVSCK